MIQLMSRAGNVSCARAADVNSPRLAAAATPSAAPPALRKKPRRSIRIVLLISSSLSSSARPRQPQAEPFVERTSIQKVCQRHVLRHETGGVDQNPLVVALAALLRARHQFMDLAMQLLARELA